MWTEVTDGFAGGFLTALSTDTNHQYCLSDCGTIAASLNGYELFDFFGTIEYNRAINALRIRVFISDTNFNDGKHYTGEVYMFTKNGRK